MEVRIALTNLTSQHFLVCPKTGVDFHWVLKLSYMCSLANIDLQNTKSFMAHVVDDQYFYYIVISFHYSNLQIKCNFI